MFCVRRWVNVVRFCREKVAMRRSRFSLSSVLFDVHSSSLPVGNIYTRGHEPIRIATLVTVTKFENLTIKFEIVV